MIPIETFLKRTITSSSINYSMAEGNFFKGRLNDISYSTSSGSEPLDLGDFNYKTNIAINGAEVAFNNDDMSTTGLFKINIFNGNVLISDFTTEVEYGTNGLGFIDITISIDSFSIINGTCNYIDGQISLSNNAFDESVAGNLRCINDGEYEADLFNANGIEMGTLIYRPGFIDLEIETAILKADVSVFLGKRMGFTIPL